MFLLSLCAIHLHAQITHGVKQMSMVIYKNNLVAIDSLVLIPGTVSIISDENIDTSNIILDYKNATIRLKSDFPFDSAQVIVQYQNFRISTQQNYFKKDKAFIQNKMEDPQQFFRIQESNTENPWLYSDSDLNRSGSISRGISAGNNQNVIVNSDMNLQLNGKLNETFSIKAAITDRNIPLQPDGHTQQLQDFDQVYIQLYSASTQITAGDFELKNEPNHFLRFNKKLLGGSIEHTQALKDSSNLRLKTAISVSKGKYIRQEIKPSDGNQGPYKLLGENNEPFILVLAGSEKVYIDGVLKVRGDLNDYTIDYNLGEISFTPKTIITKEKRIVVEFEYSDKNYSRTFSYSQIEHKTTKNHSFVSYYVEKDLKNQSIQPQLSDDQKLFLSSMGDEVENAFYRNVDSLAFSTHEIRYKRVDTLVNGFFYDSVYVHSTHPDSAFYRIGFSHLGAGKGNYVLESNLANGRVFRWIAPLNGIPQGEYEPVMALNPPKQTQMLNAGNVLQIGNHSQLKTEIAYSSLDKNTFSKMDSQDNHGFAGLVEYNFIQKIKPKDTTNIWTFKGDVAYEYISKNFNEIESFRPVEFMRNFGLSEKNINNTQHSGRLKLSLQNKNHQLSWGIQNLLFQDVYHGLQNQWTHLSKTKRFLISNEGFYLTAQRDSINNTLLHHKSGIEYDLSFLKVGVNLSLEENLQRNNQTDSVNANSNGFTQIEWYISQRDSSKIEYKLYYLTRSDKIPDGLDLRSESKTDMLGLNFVTLKSENHNLNTSIVYSDRVFRDTIFGKSETNLGSTLDYSGTVLNKILRLNTFYETSGGQEQRRDFYYLKVAKGTGNYTWKDYNENGIEELDEFEQSVFADEGEYIKLWRLTNDYIKTYNSRFNQNIQLAAPLNWHKQKNFKGFLARFSNQFNFRSDKKLQNNAFQAYNPLAFNVSDSDLVSINQNLRNSFIINQKSPIWSHEFVYANGTSKMFLTGGFENRKFENINNIFRLVLFKKLTSRTDFGFGEKQYQSDQFASRNNKIKHLSVEESANFLFSTNFRWILTYKYAEKENQVSESEQLFFTLISSEITYNVTNKGVLNWKVSFVKNVFNGNQNQSIAFEMMDGLSDGINFLTSLNIQTNIGQNLQLNANYEGRLSETSKMIHTGNISLRAYF